MHRLRDLDRRQGAIAAALVALLLVPFAVSLARAADVAWLPSGDDALIGLRSLDALTPERALIGQPSTSHLYADDVGAHHPGPIEFFWLAIPVRVLAPVRVRLLVRRMVVDAHAWPCRVRARSRA